MLFIFNAVGAAVCAYGLLKGASWAWPLGILVAGGAFVAFILCRTTGLPSFKEDEWEGLGLLSLVVEGAFVIVAATAMSRRTAAARA